MSSQKTKIAIVTIGHMPFDFDWTKLKKWKSSLFEITGDIQSYALNANSDAVDWTFTDEKIEEVIPKDTAGDLLIAIVSVPIQYNWYSRRLNNNRAVVTFHEMSMILNHHDIPLENIILRILYAYTIAYKRNDNQLPSVNEKVDLLHDETRGCLFDMNPNKIDIIASCNKPIICHSCISKLKNSKTQNISNESLELIQKEIKGIKKPLFFRITDWVKKHPILSLFISASLSIALNLLSSLLYDWFKN